jgi:hypothetical protein
MLGRSVACERILSCNFSDHQLHPFAGWVWPRGNQTFCVCLPGIADCIKITGLKVISSDLYSFLFLCFELAYSLDQCPHKLQRSVSPVPNKILGHHYCRHLVVYPARR